MDDQTKILADALNDIITMSQRIHLRGELKHGKIIPQEFINFSQQAAREALSSAGLAVRKTGKL